MRLQYRVNFIILSILLVSSSCGQSFSENPAGSKILKYNLREIGQLRSELGGFCIDEQRKAVVRGLLWLLGFTQDDNPYDIFHPSWTSITALHFTNIRRAK